MLVVSTMFELMEAVKAAADTLKQSFSNSIAISAGCDLFFRFVSSIRDTGGAVILHYHWRRAITKTRFQDFDEFKREIQQACQEYAQSVINVKETIARHINSFIKDDSIVRLISVTFVIFLTRRSTDPHTRLFPCCGQRNYCCPPIGKAYISICDRSTAEGTRS